ncbi:MAG TPA: diguanylate cyclase [Syntrophales bacterium]|nr:diguanylate cyclase [Syntrophales bacterium]
MDKSESNDIRARILIVDDHVELRDMLKEAMVLSGYDCLTAGNGREALECLAANPVDVVLTDIKMPEMNGLELTEYIKKDHNVDVIVMTGFTDDFTYEEIITKGASDFMLKPVSIPELCLRIKRVVREKALLSERNHAMERLRESEQRYQELSITDGLTKLFNSRQFYAVLRGEIERSNRYDLPLTVLMLDIDDFKKYNDTYGHLEGDRVLTRFSEIIRECLRHTDSAYRYGGEEFAVILPSTRGEQGVVTAERVRIALKNEIFKPGPDKEIRVTVSIGVAQHNKSEEMMDFLRRADQNLYTAKGAGKNQVCFTQLP